MPKSALPHARLLVPANSLPILEATHGTSARQSALIKPQSSPSRARSRPRQILAAKLVKAQHETDNKVCVESSLCLHKHLDLGFCCRARDLVTS
jgi:hypothetical protein